VAILRGCRLRPVDAVQTWLGAAEIYTGPVFPPVLKSQRVQAVPLLPFSAAQIHEGVRRARRPRPGAVRRWTGSGC